jgi:hypothetical protein
MLIGTLALLAGLGVLGRATRADALTPPPEGWGAAYERAAVEYWGEATTRCASASITFDSPLPESHHLVQEDGRVLGQATITYASGVHCQMWIAPLYGLGIYFRCVLFAHEYGHWIGHPDDPADPRDSVGAELLGSYTRDAPCRRLVASVT